MVELPHHADLVHKWLLSLFLCVYQLLREGLDCKPAFVLNPADHVDVCKITLPDFLNRSVSIVKVSLDKCFCEKFSPDFQFLWLQRGWNSYLFLIPLKYYRMELWQIFLVFAFFNWKIQPATKRNTNQGILFLNLYFVFFTLSRNITAESYSRQQVSR